MTLTVYFDDVAGRTPRNPRPHGRSLIPFRGQSSPCRFVSVRLACPSAIADTLLRYREEFGISYIGALQDHMRTFAEVIPLLR